MQEHLPPFSDILKNSFIMTGINCFGITPPTDSSIKSIFVFISIGRGCRYDEIKFKLAYMEIIRFNFIKEILSIGNAANARGRTDKTRELLTHRVHSVYFVPKFQLTTKPKKSSLSV